MNRYDNVKEVFKTVGEIAKKSDFLSAGLKTGDVYALCKKGYITRIKKGYYMLSDNDMPKEEMLLSKLMTQGIICMESALFYYGYNDFAPREWTIAFPRAFFRTAKAAQKEVPIKAYYVPNVVYRLGETEGSFNGVMLPMYNRERTICDCFKYRTKMDNEMFNKAVNAYVVDPQKNLADLSEYAKKIGVYKKMMNVMEVLLNV